MQCDVLYAETDSQGAGTGEASSEDLEICGDPVEAYPYHRRRRHRDLSCH